MFHFLNDLYVQSEIYLTNEIARVNISDSTGFPYVNPMPTEFDPPQLGFGRSLDDLGPEAFGELVAKASEHGSKVVFYVDSPTYSRIYSILLKTLFPRIPKAQFDFFFLCKKAVVDGKAATSYSPKIDPRAGTLITKPYIDELYSKNDSEFIKVLGKFVKDSETNLSLEWNVLKLITDGAVGNTPQKLKNILKRVALSVAHETLGSIAFWMTVPDKWEFLGCDQDTLLSSESIFQGCYNLGFLNNKVFVGQSTLGLNMPDRWMEELMGQLFGFLEMAGEVKSRLFMGVVLDLWKRNWKHQTAEECLWMFRQVFDNGDKTVSLPHHDNGKYDENLIRYLLRTPPETLATLRSGSLW